MKSGATAISSDMFFGNEEHPKNIDNQGRWSAPVNISALGEKLHDHYLARSSVGSESGSVEGYKEAAKEKAGQIYEKGTYVASGAY